MANRGRGCFIRTIAYWEDPAGGFAGSCAQCDRDGGARVLKKQGPEAFAVCPAWLQDQRYPIPAEPLASNPMRTLQTRIVDSLVVAKKSFSAWTLAATSCTLRI